jgi:hypothetical protein
MKFSGPAVTTYGKLDLISKKSLLDLISKKSLSKIECVFKVDFDKSPVEALAITMIVRLTVSTSIKGSQKP